MIAAALARLRSRGFVGPRYAGLLGRIRFVTQHLVVRREVVLVATRDTAVFDDAPTITLRSIRTWRELEPFIAVIDSDYHAGYTKRWRRVLEWGEELFLVFRGDAVAGFGWAQRGEHAQIASHYGPIPEGDYRLLRVGVLPSWRRQGINRAFYRAVLRELFSRGAQRVYVDCSRDNLPSLAAQLEAGFRPVGEIAVTGSLVPGTWVRWQPARELGLPQR